MELFLYWKIISAIVHVQ